MLHGQETTSDEIGGALQHCFRLCADPFEQALLLSTKLAVHQIARLATTSALRRAGINDEVIHRIVADGVLTLLPPQCKAVEAGLLTSEGNAFFSLPTSAGKTLLGELCMLHGLAAGSGAACFIAPYIAVGRQVAAALRRHVPDDITVCELFGAFGAAPRTTIDAPKVAIVATPERFDGLLRQGATFAARLRCVVIDEAHLVDNDIRGVLLEGLIARLRLLQRQGYQFRVVALSAVIAQPQAFCDWLGVQDISRFVDPWRPTARRLGVWTQDGSLLWYRSDDILRPEGTRRTSPLGHRTLPWPDNQTQPAALHGVVKKQRPRLYANVAFLCDLLNADIGSPTLCICSSRHATRLLASVVAARREDATELGPKQAQLIERIEGQDHYLRPLANMVRRGVAYHNSTLPQNVRFLIEDAVKEKSLTVVAATTTLAEGVDLPFRNTIIADWLVYRSGGERPMPPLLFRNIAGRCGRAGTFTEGDTIIFDNVLGDLNHTLPHVRERSRSSLLAEPPPLQSLLAQELVEEAQPEAQATLEAQFVAAIGENPANDNLSSAFAACLYSAHTGLGAAVRERVNRIERRLLGGEERYAFARAASPIFLTDLGVAANASGFSPQSAAAGRLASRPRPYQVIRGSIYQYSALVVAPTRAAIS